jgi:Fic family protein
MNIIEKLKAIQQVTDMTQTELAAKIGISFVALNSLINGKSQPRDKTLLAIDDLYESITGTKKIPADALSAKKQIVIAKSRKYSNIVEAISKNKSVFDQFLLELTFHTNGIEGSTLSEGETAAILFENSTIAGKSLVEQLEAKNHQTALVYLFEYLSKSKTISEDLILKLHSILLNSIHSDAGIYRRHGVRIVGANLPTANYLKIPDLMAVLVKDINKSKVDIIAHAAEIHARFEQIHPFPDGNGRIGRLILQSMMLRKNLPPAVIKQGKKVIYLQYLNKAQTTGDQSLLDDFLCDAINDGYGILDD